MHERHFHCLQLRKESESAARALLNIEPDTPATSTLGQSSRWHLIGSFHTSGAWQYSQNKVEFDTEDQVLFLNISNFQINLKKITKNMYML